MPHSHGRPPLHHRGGASSPVNSLNITGPGGDSIYWPRECNASALSVVLIYTAQYCAWFFPSTRGVCARFLPLVALLLPQPSKGHQYVNMLHGVLPYKCNGTLKQCHHLGFQPKEELVQHLHSQNDSSAMKNTNNIYDWYDKKNGQVLKLG